MNVEPIQILSVGVAMVALSVAVLHAVRDWVIGAARRRRRRSEDGSARAGAPGAGSGPARPGAPGQPAGGAGDAEADRPPAAATGEARTKEGGNSHDPRAQEDTAQRRIAYQLVAILAFVIVSVVALVAFGVIAVDDVEKFGVIVAPVVTLVTAATTSYFSDRRNGK